jgi:hypothetical protein
MSPVGFERTIPASARPQTYALDREATWYVPNTNPNGVISETTGTIDTAVTTSNLSRNDFIVRPPIKLIGHIYLLITKNYGYCPFLILVGVVSLSVISSYFQDFVIPMF